MTRLTWLPGQHALTEVDIVVVHLAGLQVKIHENADVHKPIYLCAGKAELGARDLGTVD